MGGSSPTPSKSISKTPSRTPSVTPSLSISATPSLSISETPSLTPTTTPSLSISITPSLTPTTTPSLSFSATQTPSLSFSATQTPSLSFSATQTPSLSISETPSLTPTTTPSLSFSATQTPSLSFSATQTPSLSFSATQTPSLSISETPSLTPTTTPSLSISATPSLSISVTPSITPTATPSLSISQTPSLTPTRTPSLSISATPSLSISTTPSLTPTRTPSLSISTTPSLSISATQTPSLSISRTPSLTPTRTPSLSISTTPSLSISATQTPSLSISVTPSLSISATPSLSISATPSLSISETPSETPSLTPSETPSETPTPTPTPSLPTLTRGFITEWTVSGDVDARTITLPFIECDTYDCVIDWGDNTSTSTVTAYDDSNRIHTYAEDGTYQIEITGEAPGWCLINHPDSGKITAVIYWGDSTDFGGFVNISYGFEGCVNLTSIGTGKILAKSTLISLIELFLFAPITNIPSGFFDNCVNATDISFMFGYTQISSVPAGLFDNLTLVDTVGAIFEGCSNLTNTGIPTDLFRYNTEITIMAGVFRGTSVSYEPPDAFLYNTKVITFANVFQDCINLTGITDSAYFRHTTASSIDFQAALQGCSILETLPNGLFGGDGLLFNSFLWECPKFQFSANLFLAPGQTSSDRFFDKSPEFDSAFMRESFTGVLGTAPDLWDYDYGSGTPIYNQCFSGSGNNLVSISNYCEIPAEWGADLTPCVSPTPSETPSETPTPTPSETPSQTPSITISITQTPSLSISETPSLSISKTPTPTPTQGLGPELVDQLQWNTEGLGWWDLYDAGWSADNIKVTSDGVGVTQYLQKRYVLEAGKTYRWQMSAITRSGACNVYAGVWPEIYTISSNITDLILTPVANETYIIFVAIYWNGDITSLSIREILPLPTPSLSISATITPTPSLSISATPSLSISATPSLSISATPSLSISITPSLSISMTPSLSISRTRTPSLTPSETPSLSISATPSLSISATPSLSISETPSISISATPSLTPTITPTPSQSRRLTNIIKTIIGKIDSVKLIGIIPTPRLIVGNIQSADIIGNIPSADIIGNIPSADIIGTYKDAIALISPTPSLSISPTITPSLSISPTITPSTSNMYSAELITNGGFDSLDAWLLSTVGSIHDGRLFVNNPSGDDFISQGAAFGELGEYYRVIMDVYDLAGTGNLYYGTGGAWKLIPNSGHIDEVVTFIGYYYSFYFYTEGNKSCSIDNVSARRLL